MNDFKQHLSIYIYKYLIHNNIIVVKSKVLLFLFKFGNVPNEVRSDFD